LSWLSAPGGVGRAIDRKRSYAWSWMLGCVCLVGARLQCSLLSAERRGSHELDAFAARARHGHFNGRHVCRSHGVFDINWTIAREVHVARRGSDPSRRSCALMLPVIWWGVRVNAVVEETPPRELAPIKSKTHTASSDLLSTSVIVATFQRCVVSVLGCKASTSTS